MSIQKIQGFLYIFSIGFLCNVSLTGCHTLLDMIIQAGSSLSTVSWQTPVTGSELVQSVKQLYGILYRCSTGIWSKIFSMILFHFTRKQDSWKFFSHCHLDIRISLIILQHGIIFGSVFLDQVIFQHQRFQLRIRHNIFKPADKRYHFVDLWSSSNIFAKIRADTIMEVDRFPYVNNSIRFIMHDINPRTPGKLP